MDGAKWATMEKLQTAWGKIWPSSKKAALSIQLELQQTSLNQVYSEWCSHCNMKKKVEKAIKLFTKHWKIMYQKDWLSHPGFVLFIQKFPYKNPPNIFSHIFVVFHFIASSIEVCLFVLTCFEVINLVVYLRQPVAILALEARKKKKTDGCLISCLRCGMKVSLLGVLEFIF